MAKWNGKQNVIPLFKPKGKLEKLAIWILILNLIQIGLFTVFLLSK